MSISNGMHPNKEVYDETRPPKSYVGEHLGNHSFESPNPENLVQGSAWKIIDLSAQIDDIFSCEWSCCLLKVIQKIHLGERAGRGGKLEWCVFLSEVMWRGGKLGWCGRHLAPIVLSLSPFLNIVVNWVQCFGVVFFILRTRSFIELGKEVWRRSSPCPKLVLVVVRRFPPKTSPIVSSSTVLRVRPGCQSTAPVGLMGRLA